MMANINRDYLVVVDVKNSTTTIERPMSFYITDKYTQNIYINLVINVSDDELIAEYANIENAEDFKVVMNIVKPNNDYKVIEGKLWDKNKAIFEFDLPIECVDVVGKYTCELLTICTINGREEITTSNKISYKVKKSVLNDLDNIIEDTTEYPLVVQLFDKLSDIDQYEEDRRANELARQLAEAKRQENYDALVTDIDNYKTAKDQEIDEYKAAKDSEINTAIAAQNNKIDAAINAQNDRIAVVESNVGAQNNKLDAIEAKNTEQDNRLDIAENRLANIGNDITNTMQPIIDGHTSRLDAIEAIDVAQNTRLDAIEARNQQQDDRLLDIEKVNKKQDIDIKCLFTEAKNNMINITEEGNSIYLQNSTTGHAFIDEIKGSTLVNCNKEVDKELILNGNINTSADNAVTVTEGVDGGLVDVALEGNTLVNVSKTKDSTAITKAYTVENSGNHIALQGDVNGSCRPVIEGNTLVNLLSYIKSASNINWKCEFPVNCIKENTDYTVIFELYDIVNSDAINELFLSIENVAYAQQTIVDFTEGIKIANITTRNSTSDPALDLSQTVNLCCWIPKGTTSSYSIKNIIILEGDYTDKPIPDYFEGLQSSFEDKLVTQEMIDNGEEEADNLGKYRVDYKVTGKNKVPYVEVGDILQNSGQEIDNPTISRTGYIFMKANKTYYITNNSVTGSEWYANMWYDKNKTFLRAGYEASTVTPKQDMYLRIKIHNPNSEEWIVQVEEGTVATAYEPYKEHIKTLYLNSPLLEGDTIEEKDGGIYHVHRYKKVVLNGNENWTKAAISGEVFSQFIYQPGDKANCTPICDKLPVKPKSELIENDIIVSEGVRDSVSSLQICINNDRLPSNTATDFKQWLSENPLTVVYQLASPTYEVISTNDSVLMDSYANGHLDVDSAVPVDKVDFLPFSEELTYLYANTQYTVRFVSDKATTADITLGGTQLLAQSIVAGLNRITITTPATLIDNKLVIDGVGANISEAVVTDTNRYFGYFEGMKSVGECEELKITSTNSDNTLSNAQQLPHEPLRAVGDVKDRYVMADGKWYIERNCDKIAIDGSYNWKKNSNGTIYYMQAKFSSDKYVLPTLNSKACNMVCDKRIVTYVDWIYSKEPNSVIGYIVLTKDGTFGLSLDNKTPEQLKSELTSNPIIVILQLKAPTYEPIDYNPLEVYSGTTHITTNSVIPTNITVKNTGFNCLLKPNTTYTISSNLGLNTVTTGADIGDSCLRFMDTDTSDVTTMRDVLVLEGDWTTKADLIPANFSGIESAFEQEYDAEKGKYKVNAKVVNEDKTKENNITFYINEPLRGVGDVKDRVYILNNKVVVERNCGIRAYEDGDFGTYLTDKINTVYQLASPTYEEVEYVDDKLMLESFKNSTLFYNSNVPVTSKLYYSYSVPLVDTVAQTANISDEQDAMIIDLATQVAVLEMLM